MKAAGTAKSYLRGPELAEWLGLSEKVISDLGKKQVLVRKPDPANRREFLYEVRSSVRGYIASLRAPLEKAQLAFTLEKARTEKYRAQKLALEIAAKGGKLVEREAMLKGIVEGLVAFKRRLSAVPTRVSGAFASSAQERRRLEELLEKEVNDTLEVLVSILEAGDGEQAHTRNGSEAASRSS